MKQHFYILLIAIFSLGGCSTAEVDDSNNNNNYSDDDVVEWMDGLLSRYYLYNDEYNSMDVNTSLSWDTFLKTTLTSMTTNVLDNKDGSIYSYVYRTGYTSTTAVSTTRISESKILEWDFGLAALFPVVMMDYSYGIAVAGVYPDSPLYSQGVRRGDIITKVNGYSITSANYSDYAYAVAYPSSATTLSLTILNAATFAESAVRVTAEQIYCNPVLHYDIYDGNVGYISYLSFDAAYDSELLDVLAEFKAAGVKDLILDLRLNGGGYVDSANKLATAIAGEASENKVFAYCQYSESYRSTPVTKSFWSGLSSYYLNLTTLYCLVDNATASASELVINSLRGIDVEVILIGDTTEGKNVAMGVYTSSFDDGYSYEFAPIMMILSNAKGFSEYETGFSVGEHTVDDWNEGYNFSDFTQNEVMIKYARNLISGTYTATYAITKAASSATPLTKMDETMQFSRSYKRGNLVPME